MIVLRNLMALNVTTTVAFMQLSCDVGVRLFSSISQCQGEGALSPYRIYASITAQTKFVSIVAHLLEDEYKIGVCGAA
jgi:hypothetical protein